MALDKICRECKRTHCPDGSGECPVHFDRKVKIFAKNKCTNPSFGCFYLDFDTEDKPICTHTGTVTNAYFKSQCEICPCNVGVHK